MKVLFLLDSLAPGGTETSTAALAGGLAELGVEPVIATLRSAEHGLEDQVRGVGIEVREVRAGSLVGRVRAVRRLIRDETFDVVHTALFRADQVGRIAAWRTGVPVISSFVNTPYEESRFADPNVTRWKVRLVQAVDAVTGRFMVRRFHAVSEGVKRVNARALRVPLDRVRVAERGRDAAALGDATSERRRTARAALDLPEDAEVVVNLGRLDHQKAQSVLISATSIMAARRPNVITLIAGKDGSAAGVIHEQLGSDEVAARHVRLLGHRTDIGDLICAADILVISSIFEGTAGAAVEAMALRTPIVSTDLVGVEGILENEMNALLVPRLNAVAMAEAIERVLDDPALAARLVARGSRDYVNRFTLTAASARLSELYVDVVGAER